MAWIVEESIYGALIHAKFHPYRCRNPYLCSDAVVSGAWAQKLLIFGRPFVKRFALCCRTVVCPDCLSVLSVTSVYCGQTD